MMILLIGEDGEKIGHVDISVARKMASDARKDLVLVNAEKNVYRIADEGRLRYEKKQRQKMQRAVRRTHKIKEIKLSLTTEEHDLSVKSKHIKEFLSKGLKTKVTMRFKGRQMSFKQMGVDKMNALLAPLLEGGVAIVDKEMSMVGTTLTVLLSPPK